MKNLKKNMLLLLSTYAALNLFLSESFLLLLLLLAVFLVVTVAAVLDQGKPAAISNRYLRMAAILLTLLIAFSGYNTYCAAWSSSDVMETFADVLHLSQPMLLGILGLLGCVGGAYAMYTLSCWIVNITARILKEKLPEQRMSVMAANIKRNWYFPISAMAFFCLEVRLTAEYIVSLLIVFAIALVVASQIQNILNTVKKLSWYAHAASVLSAAGVCWKGQISSYATWAPSSMIQALENALSLPVDVPLCISVFGALAAFLFVYLCIAFFWTEVGRIAQDTSLFSDITKGERLVYWGLTAAMIGFAATVFLATEAFYGTEISFDLIYTSDSPLLVKNNAYLTLTFVENDLRQPLFAVFAAPFIGAPYLIGRIFAVSAPVQAILMNSVQIMLLITANYMLTKMMNLTPGKRICFMLLSCCTYTQLLFVLMMEQYIIAYFWLIFCLYLICERKRPARIALWGTGGTLLTGLILLPAMSDKSPVKDFKAWLGDMVQYGMEFVAVLLAFGRFDIFYYLTVKISSLGGFTGERVSFADKLNQYTAFVHNCIAAPAAGVDTTTFDYVSWQLKPVTGIHYVGIVILLLVIVSAVVNWDKKSSLLAAGWAGFSVVILLGLGWGTQENGLILYALYFGWAFLALLFQLVEAIEKKLNVRFLIPVVSIGCAAALAAVNLPAIIEMVSFAVSHYPV